MVEKNKDLSSVIKVFHCFTVYEAGKAVKKGVASQYAATLYAPSMYSQPAYGGMSQQGIPMLPLPNGVGAAPPQNGYSRDYDGASSGKACSVRLVFFEQRGIAGTCLLCFFVFFNSVN